MIILPYSTALSLSRPPVITYSVIALCVLVFFNQQGDIDFTLSMAYYPESWNPVNMLTSALAHSSWSHLIGNMLFFLAFAPALEFLIGSRLRYLWIMVLISLAVGVGHSLSVVLGVMDSLPSLGFSGVVMGMIGLSAYLMPQARVRVFWWYIYGGSVLHVRAWILAVFYIGMDTWTMLTASDYESINVVAHVVGGVAGYLYGYLRLKDRREETREELEQEISAMNARKQRGRIGEEAHRYRQLSSKREPELQAQKDHDKFMSRLYQMVQAHRDGEAVLLFLTRYGNDTPCHELEQVFEYVLKEWPPSRFSLCLGRLIIYRLDSEKRYAKALLVIEKCQGINPEFLIFDVARVIHYAELAVNAGKQKVAENLVKNSQQRYGELINHDRCNHVFQCVLKNSSSRING